MNKIHILSALGLIAAIYIADTTASMWWPGYEQPKEKDIKYVATFPSVIMKSKVFAFHLTLFPNENYSLPVSFVANLTSNGRSLANQRFTQNSYGMQKHEFTNLNQITIDDEMYPNVEIEFTNNELKNYSVSGRANPLEETFVYIQTDKMMYKPGQKVNLRVLVLNRELEAVRGSVSVVIQDPKSNRLKAWNNQQLQRGVFTNFYQLSDFVNEGDWKIMVSGADISSSERTFIVQQYVLPKFEVGLDFKQQDDSTYWLFNAYDETTYKGKVSATYTFGKPVKGMAKIKMTGTGGCNYQYDASGNPDYYYWMPRAKNITVLELSVTLKGDGSANDGEFTLFGLNQNVVEPERPPISVIVDGLERPEPPMPPQQNLKLRAPSCQLSFQVNVTEDLTEELQTSEETVMLFRDRYEVMVHESVQKTLKPGLPFTMRFKVSLPDGTPVGSNPVQVKQQVYFFDEKTSSQYRSVACGNRYYGAPEPEEVPPSPYLDQTSWTDSDSTVTMNVNVPKSATSVLFKATIVNSDVEFCESRYPPETLSKQAVSISIDRPDGMPKVGDLMDFKITSTFRVSMIYFMLVQNGQPFVYKQITSPTEQTADGTTFMVSERLPEGSAPRCAAAIWTVENGTGEILADAVEFKVDGLIRQNVSASFSPEQVRPGEDTELTVRTTEPNSFVALLAIDKSVRLLKSGNDITLNDVITAVGAGKSRNPWDFTPVVPLLWRCFRCGWYPWWIDSSNAESVFSGVGMTIKSNVNTGNSKRSWARTLNMPDLSRRRGGPSMVAERGGPKVMPPGTEEDAIRLLFPETWIWREIGTNSEGALSMQLQAPDTITTWELTAFSIGNNNGFGALEEPVELTVFKEFFVNLDVSDPTIIRGEQVEIKAVVFNYQSHDSSVTIRLHQSNDFSVSINNGVTFKNQDFQITVHAKANSGESVPIWIKASTLGKIKMRLTGRGSQGATDAMEKEVLVEPEGEIKYANKPLFIRLTPRQRSITERIEVDKMLGQVSNDMVVSGSKMFQLQAIGDILGPALSQMGSQIRLPTGCGEQTMVILAPNVYIYKYLQAANLGNDELNAKAVSFVQQGYQRELRYQRSDGGFSAFGDSDDASSTWLTAFVLRCFAAAKKHVGTDVEDEHVENGWNFLRSQTQRNGLFSEPGKVIHSSMKGGATSDINLAAYIYTTAAEAGIDMRSFRETRQRIVSRAKSSAATDAYQLALIAYGLSIRPADRADARVVLQKLMNMAARDVPGLTYWKPNNDQSGIDEYQQSGPTKIETSAYALLAYLNLNGVTDDAIPIGRWLMAQRNSLGGFASTQDTVVGLQAISELAAGLRSNGQRFSIEATMRFDDGSQVTHSFRVNASSSQLLQSFDPPRDKQDLKTVDLRVQGIGVGLVQLAMRYNVQDNNILNSGDYDIVVSRSTIARKRRDAGNAQQPGEVDRQVFLEACVHPRTLEPGMVVLEVGIPTGFEGDLEGTKARNFIPTTGSYRQRNLKLIELEKKKLVFYFDSMNNQETVCVNTVMLRKSPAVNVQNPTVRVYSYYDPSRSTAAEFNFPGMSYDDITACQNIKYKVACPN